MQYYTDPGLSSAQQRPLQSELETNLYESAVGMLLELIHAIKFCDHSELVQDAKLIKRFLLEHSRDVRKHPERSRQHILLQE